MFSSGFLLSSVSAQRAGGPLVPQDEMYKVVSLAGDAELRDDVKPWDGANEEAEPINKRRGR